MMRYLLAACVMLATAASAQTAPQRVDDAPSVAGACTVVPILPDAPIPVVEVTIAGKPYRFGVDTGAQGHGRIRQSLAEALGLKMVGEVGTPAPGGTIASRPIFGVPELSVGGMDFRNVQLVALSSMRGPDAGWDGILGIGLFQQLTLTLDYGNARAMIGQAGLTKGLPVVPDHGVPTVPLTIAGKTFAVDLDTGNGAAALFLAEADAKALPFSGEPVERGRARTSFGEFAILEAPLAVPVMAGTATLPVKTVGWPSARPGGNLGSKGLAGMSVAIDQRAALVDIHPSAAPPACPA